MSRHAAVLEARVETPGACSLASRTSQPPGSAEVSIRMLMAPINPADLLEIDGRYGGTRPLPFVPGAEGAGMIETVGESVQGFKPGDLVMCLSRGNWTSHRTVEATSVLSLPADVPPEMACMLRVNPATAWLLLEEHASMLAPGTPIILNAAGSAVGRLMIQLARRKRLKPIAIVRDERYREELLQLGAEHVVSTGEGLARTVRSHFERGVPVAFDCVAGPQSAALVECLQTGGRLVVYGHASGRPCEIPSMALTFKAVQVCGFNLGRAIASRSQAATASMYAALARAFVAQELVVPIEKVYRLKDLSMAILRARDDGRAGKVVIDLSSVEVTS